MNYELKDKITITQELLSELEMKGWQEIEHLQDQINNLAEGPANDKLRQLFKNLLTSYYVFTGGIETLASEPISSVSAQQEAKLEEPATNTIIEPMTDELDSVNSAEDFIFGNVVFTCINVIFRNGCEMAVVC